MIWTIIKWVLIAFIPFVIYLLTPTFKGKLIIPLLCFALALIGSFQELRKEQIIPEEKQALSPKVDIKLFSFPDKAATPYKYPLKRFILMVQNLNKNSVPIFDFRIEFTFKNIIEEIKPEPLLVTGGSISVGGIKVYGSKKNGSEFRYEEKPMETALSQNFSLSIKKAQMNGEEINTNIAVFTCKRWPEKADFAADIIVDLSEEPKIVKMPSKIGRYEGTYFYEIKGKKFSERVSGSIPEVAKPK